MKRPRPEGRERYPVGLRQQLLLAAVECSGGDLTKEFTAEDLLITAWKSNPTSWGLRGHETEHPDSEKVYVVIDRATLHGQNVKGGIVGLGLLERVRERTYHLTPSGLAFAGKASGAGSAAQSLAERGLSDAIDTILSHPVFMEWLKNPETPKNFRDAGHFWGVAAGTPPNVIRTRIASVEGTLRKAKELLEEKNVDEIWARHGRALFDSNDISRAEEFEQMLKSRFAKDLATLGVILE